jgi:hypothetical protein
MGDFAKIISLLLHSRTQTHIFHLQTKSFAEHNALNNYYDGIVDLIDGLTESYQGKYGILKGYTNYKILDYTNKNQVIVFFENLENKTSTLRNSVKDSYIQNQIDNVIELINSTLYKLKFLS